jgi:hypothetical protein
LIVPVANSELGRPVGERDVLASKLSCSLHRQRRCLRPAGFIAVAISLTTAALVTAQAPLPDVARVVEAAKVIAATRNALGGEPRLEVNAKIDPKTFATTK